MALLGVGDTLLSESFTRTTSLQALSHLYIPFSVLLTLFVIGFLYWWRDGSQSSSNSKTASHCYSEDKPEVIIVGAGVVGSAMAVVLGREGRHVVVIERDMKEPDRIVGELLQPGGVMVLQELGLADCLQDIDAHTIRGYVIHNASCGSSLKVPYPTESDDVCEGRALHHGRFIMRLREAMLQLPTVRVIEGTVDKLMEEGDTVTGVRYQEKGSDESEEMCAPLTIVADGCFSRFRRQLLRESPTVKSHFVGFLMHNCPQAEANHAELVLCEPSPVLIYQISSTCTRVLVDVRGATLPKDIRQYLRERIYPQLPGHIKGPFLEGIESERLRSMPNSYLPPAPIVRRGVLCLGDAVNMRHPLTGGGMTVGLSDVKMARHLFSRVGDFAEHKLVLRAVRALYLRRKHQHSFVVNVLAQALYELFAADDEHLWKMKQACFDYFQLGGACISGPVGLLSILEPKPYILIGHFFAVALYAVYITVRKAPVWCLHRSVLTSVGIVLAACKVIFPLMWSELKTIVRPCS